MFDEKENEREIALVTEWKGGSQTAIEKLLHKYMPLISKLAREAYRTADYEDSRQDLILYFLESAKTYDPKRNGSFSGYMVKMLYWNTYNRFGKDQYRDAHEELTLDDQEEQGVPPTYPLETMDTLKETARTAQLNDKQTMIFILWMLGKSRNEIAQTLGTTTRSIDRAKRAITMSLHKHASELEKFVLD